MPAWEGGNLELLRKKAHANLDRLLPYVEAGAKVVAINPTCSMMLRREWPELLEGEDRERAKRLAEAVADPNEFLWSIREEPRFNTDFKSSPGTPSPTTRLAISAPKVWASKGETFCVTSLA